MPRPRSDIRHRVLTAARKVFLQEGVDGASLRKIAREARTSIGMIYYYFPTKDDLFLGVVEEVYAKVVEDIAAALRNEAPFEERMKQFYIRIGGLSRTEMEVVRLVLREALVSSPRMGRVIERFKRGHVALLAAAVGDGIADSTLTATLHPGLMVVCSLAVGAAPQILIRLLGKNLPFDDLPAGPALADELVSVLLRGISAGPVRSPRGTSA